MQFLLLAILASSSVSIAMRIGTEKVEHNYGMLTMNFPQDMNLDAVRKVSKLEDEMDTLEEEMREKHIERLSKQICNASSGVIFLDIVSNLERISDHAYNVAGYVKDEL
jgi:phosphate:Na+ symporter